MVTVGILQPGYLPWLGFFEQMARSDVFVIYDDVQYDKGSWRNRNRIKTANGAQWLTVPVHAGTSDGMMVRDVMVDNRRDWRKKHLASIRQSYSKTIFFDKYIALFEEAYSRQWERLHELDMFFIRKLAESLGLDSGKIVYSSDVKTEGDRLTRLVNICKEHQAEIFYEGAAGRNYIDVKFFEKHGVKVVFQDYKHPEYTQLYGEFVPYLSVVDLMFNHGTASLDIIKTGQVNQ